MKDNIIIIIKGASVYSSCQSSDVALREERNEHRLNDGRKPITKTSCANRMKCLGVTRETTEKCIMLIENKQCNKQWLKGYGGIIHI